MVFKRHKKRLNTSIFYEVFFSSTLDWQNALYIYTKKVSKKNLRIASDLKTYQIHT
jgi:hypothetical protein